MSTVVYKLEKPAEFSHDEKGVFVKMLLQQGKVNDPTITKLNRCKSLCVCSVNKEIVSIGAIKPKTKSDFGSNKANLAKLEDQFQFELGYCFTLPEYSGKGYSSKIVQLLIDNIDGENLMASTELRTGNSMLRILEQNGFRQFGNPWKSTIHHGTLGLFLRFSR